MSHKECVEIAYKWLLKNGRIGVVFKELSSIAQEIPDVIGFDSSESVLIECKVSRSDFLQDKKKKHRDHGMGTWRFYCCPKGLIKKEELPEKWGLIYIDEKGKARVEYDCRVKKIFKEATKYDLLYLPRTVKDGKVSRLTRADENRFVPNHKTERNIMYSALRRLFIKGYMKHIYDKKYPKKITVNDIIELNKTQ